MLTHALRVFAELLKDNLAAPTSSSREIASSLGVTFRLNCFQAPVVEPGVCASGLCNSFFANDTVENVDDCAVNILAATSTGTRLMNVQSVVLVEWMNPMMPPASWPLALLKAEP